HHDTGARPNKDGRQKKAAVLAKRRPHSQKPDYSVTCTCRRRPFISCRDGGRLFCLLSCWPLCPSSHPLTPFVLNADIAGGDNSRPRLTSPQLRSQVKGRWCAT